VGQVESSVTLSRATSIVGGVAALGKGLQAIDPQQHAKSARTMRNSAKNVMR